MAQRPKPEAAPIAAAAVVPAVAAAAQAPAAFLSMETLKTGLQALAIYLSISVLLPRLLGSTQTAGRAPAVPNLNSTANGNQSALMRPLVNIWPTALLDVTIQLATDDATETLPSTTWEGIDYSSSSAWSKEFVFQFDTPYSVQHNESLYADLYVSQTSTISGEERDVLHIRKELTRFKAKKRHRAEKNLLRSTTEDEEAEAAESLRIQNETLPILSLYHQNLTLEVVRAGGAVILAQLTPHLQTKINVVPSKTDIETGEGFHYPILFANEFWRLNSDLIVLNETVKTLSLHVTLSPSSFFTFQALQTLDEAFTNQASGGMGGAELDEMKRVLSETSIWLLVTTVVVTLLSTISNFVAFSSDVADWKSKRNFVGVSWRGIIYNVFTQLVILLYLLDNNVETSWVILGSQVVSLGIEAWKITKVLDIKKVEGGRFGGYEIVDKHVLSPAEIETQRFDRIAWRWTLTGLTPPLICFIIYSLLYSTHRSVYSFAITTTAEAVYLASFAQLIPGIILNYHLKSVAHLNRRTLLAKFFTTIVDDFGAIIIAQPWLYRLAAFRDDVVFVILLYQMYIYKVDYSRVNEYGQSTEVESKKDI